MNLAPPILRHHYSLEIILDPPVKCGKTAAILSLLIQSKRQRVTNTCFRKVPKKQSKISNNLTALAANRKMQVNRDLRMQQTHIEKTCVCMGGCAHPVEPHRSRQLQTHTFEPPHTVRLTCVNIGRGF